MSLDNMPVNGALRLSGTVRSEHDDGDRMLSEDVVGDERAVLPFRA